MAPILGIYASSISPYINGSSYESIATVSLTGTQSTIAFTSIPQTYKHLQVRGIGRSGSFNGASVDLEIYFNSDTGSVGANNNYRQHRLWGNGSTTGSDSYLGYIAAGRVTGNTAASNTFGPNIIDILDYTNTNKYKVTRALGGYDDNSGGVIFFDSGVWLNTAAITAITLQINSNTFAQYSSFALYGIKGA